jgi:hypothetical protein
MLNSCDSDAITMGTDGEHRSRELRLYVDCTNRHAVFVRLSGCMTGTLSSFSSLNSLPSRDIIADSIESVSLRDLGVRQLIYYCRRL